MYKSAVYKGEEWLGEVEIYPQEEKVKGEEEEEKKRIIDEVLMMLKEIRITHFSQASERCPPLAVLHTITSTGLCFKMESKNSFHSHSPLHLLHSSCIQDNKTAVMSLGGDELHLVAMYSRNNEKQYPCFWGFNVAAGLYDSCLVMLNLRCLGIVFDLDETLIVANTMRSFEDRIEALQRKMSSELDPQRISSLLAEIKRYQDDKNILKQYVENDQVVDNGKAIKTQAEVVPALSDNHQPMVRPLIRLQEKKIILTRINPQIRDTSVLVRLRPAWEELRSYLTARGRKRFEVYVCTMAERDYALEMWRLLDPESNLINSKELLDRIVCVKSGLRKSLFNVFHDGICHPKMALVIDDRLKVWDEKDQPRVHVVPAFAPYYAPQAEANNAIPVLCVARNVACNVRGGFFKEFDEGLLQKIPEISYEDNLNDIPSPPDVSNYLVSEDDSSVSNGIKDPLSFDGMADAEVDRQLKEAVSASSSTPAVVPNLDPRLLTSLQFSIASSSSSVPLPASQPSLPSFPNVQYTQAAPALKLLGQISSPEKSLQSSPAREEGEVPESELDPDTRRRLLILQHGQDNRDAIPNEASFPVRPSMQAAVPQVQPRSSWVPVEEEISARQLNQPVARQFPLESDPHPMSVDKQRPHLPPFFPKVESSVPSDRMINENQRFSKEAHYRDDRLRINQTMPNYRSFSDGIDVEKIRSSCEVEIMTDTRATVKFMNHRSSNFRREDNSLSRSSSSNKDLDLDSDRTDINAESPVGALQEISIKCGTKVEFKSALVDSRDLQFLIEAWFAGEKVGEGIGRTRREAQFQAAEDSLKNLANTYMSCAKPDSVSLHGDANRYPNANDNGFLGNLNSFGNQPLPKDDPVSFSAASETSRLLDPRLEGSEKSINSITALKEFCMMEGLGVNFLAQTPIAANSTQNNEVHAQVEIDGQILGKGIGATWDEAKMQAAERALGNLRSSFGSFAQKRQGSPRPMQGMPGKRLKPDFPRVVQRMPSSARYPKNAPPVP